jgi:hypothetical protein
VRHPFEIELLIGRSGFSSTPLFRRKSGSGVPRARSAFLILLSPGSARNDKTGSIVDGKSSYRLTESINRTVLSALTAQSHRSMFLADWCVGADRRQRSTNLAYLTTGPEAHVTVACIGLRTATPITELWTM